MSDTRSPSPVMMSDILLATEQAKAAYLGKGRDPAFTIMLNFFATIVDLVRAAERAGQDPVSFLRDGLLRMDYQLNKYANDDLNRLNRSVTARDAL